MTSKPQTGIVRGRLTDAEKARIDELALAADKPNPNRIARRLNRHVATVTWYMLTRGLIERTPRYGGAPYRCGGRMVYPYSPEQDARLLELLAAPGEFRSNTARLDFVAATLTTEFGFPRTAHSVQVRAVQLAAAPDEAAA